MRHLVLLSLLALFLGACATDDPRGTAMATGPAVGTPLGARWFCFRHSLACTRELKPVQQVAMTPEKWQELRTVQHNVNDKIRPAAFLSITDIGWHYPRHHMGDCVQYALLKRHELLMRGWPSGAVHLATAVTQHEEGHLVLIVATSQGDFVLDNLHTDIMPWNALPYRWVARQQGPSFRDWVSIAQPTLN